MIMKEWGCCSSCCCTPQLSNISDFKFRFRLSVLISLVLLPVQCRAGACSRRNLPIPTEPNPTHPATDFPLSLRASRKLQWQSVSLRCIASCGPLGRTGTDPSSQAPRDDSETQIAGHIKFTPVQSLKARGGSKPPPYGINFNLDFRLC